MDDISLNITSNVVTVPKKPISVRTTTPKAKPLRKAKASRSENNFSFEFGKNQNVKAVVARRRIVPKLSAKKTAANDPKSESPPRKNFVMRPPDSDGSDGEYERKKKATIDNIDSNLSLNVVKCTNPLEYAKAKKERLTREERMQKKRTERRLKGSQVNRVLTQQEIDDGIKKFTQNAGRKQGGNRTNGNPFKTVQNGRGPAEKNTQSAQSQNGITETPINGTESHVQPPKPQLKRKPPPANVVKKVDLFTDAPAAKIVGQRLVKPITEKVFTGVSMDSAGLHPHCVKNLADVLNITELTTVQQKTIPRALEGKDILVRSQTGSGKTLAYALPVVQKLQEVRPKPTRDCGVLAVIIVPTRELALQTYELLLKLLKPFQWIVPGFLTGGEKRKAEKARLRKGINILVGTPGRLVDHLLHTESFKLDKAKFLVLDEADRLLEMGYERDVRKIVEAIDEQREKASVTENLQRLLLSATLTPAVQKLAGLALKDPIFIDNSDDDTKINAPTENETYDASLQEALDDGKLVIPENLTMSYVVVPPKLRLVTLSGMLAKEFAKKKLKALVFVSTVEMVNFHHDLMNEQLTQKVLDDEDEPNESENDDDEPLLLGLRFFKLHGSMTQTERSGVFKAFKDSKNGVLLTTDVTGRGIDFPEIDLVIQYSPPQKIADFVHRVGRTARAGKSGRAILFLGPTETDFVRRLEDKRIRISQANVDDYLKALVAADSEAKNIQEAASNLQHKFQELIEEDKEMLDKAKKAYVSWLKFYSTFPKDLKPIFNIKVAHMGHFAKSFGLKQQPSAFAAKLAAPKPPPPTNRLTYTERDPKKMKEEKNSKKRRLGTTVTPNRFDKFIPKSISLTTSEFDSGLPALKKKKKN